MFVTYVLYSADHDKIYIGYTSDLIDRFHSHNEFAIKGYTINFVRGKLFMLNSSSQNKKHYYESSDAFLFSKPIFESGYTWSADNQFFLECTIRKNY